MDKKTKILNRIFWAIVTLSLLLAFYKTVIKQDFVIVNYFEDEESVLEDDESPESEVEVIGNENEIIQEE